MCLPSTNACMVTSIDLYGHPVIYSLFVSIQQLQIPLARLLNALCEYCNISSHNFEETSLKYSKSWRSVYFATDLVYSNYEGTITSSLLISMLSSWLLSQKNPSLNVAGESVALSKLCPIPGNTFTRETCLDLLNSQASTSTSGVHMLQVLSPAFLLERL